MIPGVSIHNEPWTDAFHESVDAVSGWRKLVSDLLIVEQVGESIVLAPVEAETQVEVPHGATCALSSPTRIAERPGRSFIDHLPPLTRREDTKPADARVHEFAAPLSAPTFAAALRVSQITTTRRPGTATHGSDDHSREGSSDG